ncbi:hypothetical protein SeMB42_g06078 [Synchytrium endobioticum]|uniref:Uncharacterized protein n=1 Tax=Synchytrium endobioticum TaxID=286115 RepID=A0A507CKI5_9FUNG|nr:hypothetical protein SeMB42_g06078 [Synchytrium endobioticum]
MGATMHHSHHGSLLITHLVYQLHFAMARTHIQRVATQPKADSKPQNAGTKGGPRILYPRAFTIAISALSQDGRVPSTGEPMGISSRISLPPIRNG